MKKNKNTYWLPDIDDHITAYNKETDTQKRDQIFETHIHIPLAKLVEYTYYCNKFSYISGEPLGIQQDCMSHLVKNMNKYDKAKGKSFSYFGLCAKHYFIQLNDREFKSNKRHISLQSNEESDESIDYIKEMWYEDKDEEDPFLFIIEYFTKYFDIIFKEGDREIANNFLDIIKEYKEIEIGSNFRSVRGFNHEFKKRFGTKIKLQKARRVRYIYMMHYERMKKIKAGKLMDFPPTEFMFYGSFKSVTIKGQPTQQYYQGYQRRLLLDRSD